MRKNQTAGCKLIGPQATLSGHVYLRIDSNWQVPDVRFKDMLEKAKQHALDCDCTVYIELKEQARNKVDAVLLVVEALKDVQVKANIGIGSAANQDAVAALGILIQNVVTCTTVLLETLTLSEDGGHWSSMLKVPSSCTDAFLLQEWLIDRELI